MRTTAKSHLFRQTVRFRGKTTTRAAVVRTLLDEGYVLQIRETKEALRKAKYCTNPAGFERNRETCYEFVKGDDSHPLTTYMQWYAVFLINKGENHEQ